MRVKRENLIFSKIKDMWITRNKKVASKKSLQKKKIGFEDNELHT